MADDLELYYKGKLTERQILESTPEAQLDLIEAGDSNKRLIQGENLQVMQSLLQVGFRKRVDLVYIDPPFATNTHFSIGIERANTVSKARRNEIAYSDTLAGAEYLEFLRQRLILIRQLLSNRGSIYVHTDSKIGHYVKILMDEIFGRSNFRNEISRIKCNPKNFQRKGFGNIKDVILFYSNADAIWNEPHVPFTRADVEKLFGKIDSQGRRYTTIPLHAPGETVNGPTGRTWRGMLPPEGRHWRSDPETLDELDRNGLIEWSSSGVPRKKIYADEKKGKRMQDVWEFKDPQYPVYPTEKRLDLLQLIIETSSNPESIVLDCFCGAGTTLVAAQELGRHWIGIDQAEAAIRIARQQLGSADYEFLIAR
jgi:adenine-specific DNA-methyltransferase